MKSELSNSNDECEYHRYQQMFDTLDIWGAESRRDLITVKNYLRDGVFTYISNNDVTVEYQTTVDELNTDLIRAVKKFALNRATNANGEYVYEFDFVVEEAGGNTEIAVNGEINQQDGLTVYDPVVIR